MVEVFWWRFLITDFSFYDKKALFFRLCRFKLGFAVSYVVDTLHIFTSCL